MRRSRSNYADRYNSFVNMLRELIATGELQPGEYLMPENALGEEYQLSRVSVRKALAQLVEEGLIEKMAGKGSRVKQPEQDRAVTTLRLVWFSSSHELDIVRRIINDFEQLHPFVKVELTVLPTLGYTSALAEMIENGRGPDLFMITDVHVREWIDQRKIGYLEGYIPAHLNEATSYPEVFNIFAHEGTILGAPFLFSPVVICYNKELLRENGIDERPALSDWDDLLRLAMQCTPEETGLTKEQYGFCFSSSYNRWPVFLIQNGGRLFSEDGRRCTLAMDRNVEALEFCTSLMYKYRVSPIYSHSNTSLAESLFAKNRVAMIMTTYYFMNEFRNQLDKWDILPMPRQRESGTLLLGGAITMNARSEQKRLARRLIDFMTGTAAQTLIKSYGATIPALRSVAEDDRLLNAAIHPKHYNYFAEILPYARPLKDLHIGERDMQLLCDELDLLWAGLESPEEACSRIEAKFNQTFQAEFEKA